MKAWLKLSVALATASFAAAPAGASVIADLSADWSDVNNPNNGNPNGTWQYRQGISDLPLTSPWTAAGSGGPSFDACSQPAWAPSNNGGNFLPAEFKANSCSANYFNTAPGNPANNVLPGDVVMHTVDGANGNPSLGVGNYLLTSAVAATFVTISGMVWDASFDSSRPQDWSLLLDGVVIDSGILDGTVSRSAAQTFDLAESSLGIGDTIELELYQDSSSPFGYFVGANLTIEGTIEGTAIPEPGTLALMLAGLGVLGVMRRRRTAE